MNAATVKFVTIPVWDFASSMKHSTQAFFDFFPSHDFEIPIVCISFPGGLHCSLPAVPEEPVQEKEKLIFDDGLVFTVQNNFTNTYKQSDKTIPAIL